MLVTVDDGRAVHVDGDPEHPITAGFLCGKVSNYLDRVYAPDRLHHPLVRDGAKGEGRFREVSWDEALDRVAGELARVRDEHGGEAILPYSYAGTQGLIQGNTMSARVMHALGASRSSARSAPPRAWSASRARTGSPPRSIPTSGTTRATS